jgi:glycosyltransferase involved in cell wall biosynthesis
MLKFSIILPVKNGGEYFKECVNSILSQTVPDFNLVILENCSNDGSPQWIRSLGDPRITMIEAEHSLSIEENWARITSLKKNEFITLIGHDDLLDNNYLEVMNALIQEHPGATLYQAHFRLIDSKGKFIRSCKPMEAKQEDHEFLSSVLQNQFDLFGTGFMLRSADYDAAGGIPDYPNLLFADFELWMEVTKKGYKATAEKECFSYRIHQSTTKTSSDLKMHAAFKRFITYLQKIRQRDNRINAVIQEQFLTFLNAYTKGLSHRLIRSPLTDRNGLSVKKFIDETHQYATLLVPGKPYHPEKDLSIKLASFIDSNSFTGKLFRFWKKIYSRPVLK